MPHAQGCSAADLALAALQAPLPAPKAPADARRSLLARSCPLPGTPGPSAGLPAGVRWDGGRASTPLLSSEQAAAEGGRGPRRAHPGLPQGHAAAADMPSSGPNAELGASAPIRAVTRAASCEPLCGTAGDWPEGLGPWAGSGLALAAPEGALALPIWQRLQTLVDLVAGLGPCMPQSCEARARRAALLCTRPFLSATRSAPLLPPALPPSWQWTWHIARADACCGGPDHAVTPCLPHAWVPGAEQGSVVALMAALRNLVQSVLVAQPRVRALGNLAAKEKTSSCSQLRHILH